MISWILKDPNEVTILEEVSLGKVLDRPILEYGNIKSLKTLGES